MPIYEYRGVTRAGKNAKGVVDADSLKSARLKLKKDGIFVQEIKDKKKGQSKGPKTQSLFSGSQKVNIRDLSLATRQLATLLKANIQLVESLGAVSDQSESPYLREVFSDLKNMVNEGSTFHRALSKYPKIFNSTYVSMCEAGEMSGTLDVILIRLAEFTEAANELQTKVKGALVYPVLMLVVTLGLLVFIFTYIIPKIVTVFDAFPDLTLPWITQVIISTSDLLISEWYLFVGGIVGFSFLFRSWKSTPQGKMKWDEIKLKLPIFGEMNRMVAVSRFTRTLATLLSGGVPMLNALQVVRNVVDNDIIARAIEEARANISEGESIAGPLKRSNQFPPIVVHMVSVGEKTGDLENMLIQVSNAFEFQLKAKIDSLTSLMGPVVLILMGLAIAVIVFAIMLPMFELNNIAG